jgi:hypothetical protein
LRACLLLRPASLLFTCGSLEQLDEGDGRALEEAINERRCGRVCVHRSVLTPKPSRYLLDYGRWAHADVPGRRSRPSVVHALQNWVGAYESARQLDFWVGVNPKVWWVVGCRGSVWVRAAMPAAAVRTSTSRRGRRGHHVQHAATRSRLRGLSYGGHPFGGALRHRWQI